MFAALLLNSAQHRCCEAVDHLTSDHGIDKAKNAAQLCCCEFFDHLTSGNDLKQKPA